LDKSPQGRFLAVNEGYLETADYAPGRRVTLTGPVTGLKKGLIGKATYTYPVVKVDDIQLWRKEQRYRPEPGFHFGIGVIFGG
ncbi:MAG TPA: Slp family lipoprotein, partial [Gammaproteobacteria bacterium]|nr:Slp family lipoprotein [Gammaproteobacteria bacterium]